MWWAIVAIREVGAFPRPFPEGCGSEVGNGGGREAPLRLFRSSLVLCFCFGSYATTRKGIGFPSGRLGLILPLRQPHSSPRVRRGRGRRGRRKKEVDKNARETLAWIGGN